MKYGRGDFRGILEFFVAAADAIIADHRSPPTLYDKRAIPGNASKPESKLAIWRIPYIGYVLMMFRRPFRLHPLHLCSLVRRFCAQICYLSRSPYHGSHGKLTIAPHGVFVSSRHFPQVMARACSAASGSAPPMPNTIS